MNKIIDSFTREGLQMPIKMSVHRLALQHGSSRMHCHRGDLSGYLYHAHCHGNRKSYEMQTLHTEVFVLSCLSLSLFPSPQPWGFYGCFYSEEAQCQPTTCMDLQNLGIPGLDWSTPGVHLQHLQSCRCSRAPQVCLTTSGSGGKSFSNI